MNPDVLIGLAQVFGGLALLALVAWLVERCCTKRD